MQSPVKWSAKSGISCQSCESRQFIYIKPALIRHSFLMTCSAVVGWLCCCLPPPPQPPQPCCLISVTSIHLWLFFGSGVYREHLKEWIRTERFEALCHGLNVGSPLLLNVQWQCHGLNVGSPLLSHTAENGHIRSPNKSICESGRAKQQRNKRKTNNICLLHICLDCYFSYFLLGFTFTSILRSHVKWLFLVSLSRACMMMQVGPSSAL